MAAHRPRNAIQLFQLHTILALASASRNPMVLRRNRIDAAAEARVDSLLWQVSVGSALGVLPAEFVTSVELATKGLPAFTLPSTVHGVDDNDEALRLFFEFASLEAELTEPELSDLVQAANPEGGLGAFIHILDTDGRDWPSYTWPLIRDTLAGSEKIEGEAAVACFEAMTQLLALAEDIVAFEKAVSELKHTAFLVGRRFADVHRAVAAITQQKGSPKHRELEHA